MSVFGFRKSASGRSGAASASWTMASLAAALFALVAWSAHDSWRIALHSTSADLEHLARLNASSLALRLHDAERLEKAVRARLTAPEAAGGSIDAVLADELSARFDGDAVVDLLGTTEGRPTFQSATTSTAPFDPSVLALQLDRAARRTVPTVGWAYPRAGGWWLPVFHRTAGDAWLVVSLPVATLSVEWASPRLTGVSPIGLRGEDDRILLRKPFTPAMMGADASKSDSAVQIATAVSAGTVSGGFRTVATETDSVDRLIGWSVVPGTQLRSLVATDVANVWSLWLRQTGYFAAAIVCTLLLMFASGAVGLRRLAAARNAHRHARAESTRALELVEHALDASRDTTWHVDADRRLVFADNFATLLGTEPGPRAAVAASLEGLLARTIEGHRPMLQQAVERTVSHGEPLYVEFKALGVDGVERHMVIKGGARHGRGLGRDALAVGTLRDVSRLMGAQTALAQTAETLQRMCALAKIGPWVVELPSLQLSLSDTARRIYELAPDAVTPGWLDFDASQGHHQRLLNRARRLLLERGVGYDLVVPIGDPSTATRWIRTVASARHVDGRMVAIDGAIQDVTDLVHVEAALDEAGRRARQLGAAVECSSQLAIVTDLEQRTTWCNEAFCRRTGYALDEIVGRLPGPLLQRDDVPPALRDLMRRNLRARIGFGAVRLPNYTKEGTRYWIDLEVHPVLDAEGRVEGFVGVSTDVTHDIEREAALSEVTSRFELATRSARIGVWEHDLVRDTGKWNDAQYDLCGIVDRSQPVTTATIVALMHPDDVSTQARAYDDALWDPSAPGWQGLYRVRCPRSGWRWLRTITTFERNAHGAAVKVVGTSVDVSAEKAVQEAEAARLAAEARSEAKNLFVSQMSHELRTPLNAVIGYAQLMTAGDTSAATTLERAGRIERAGWHLLALIDDILDLSRIEAGNIRVQAEPVALGPLLEDVTAFVAALATRQDVHLQIDATDLFVLGDSTRMRQVLINLVSNAIKYNRSGGSVTVRCSAAAAQVTITVADTGHGMTAEQQARLFNPFERLGREHSTVEGTGLGLAITRGLVDCMKGSLTIDSVVDEGTIARLDLPMAHRPAEARTEFADLEHEPRDDWRVLCIEDNEVNALVFREALSVLRPTWRCDVAESLAEARTMASALPFDLFFVDLNLPDGSGLSLVGRGAGAAADADRVILLTADAADATQQAAQAMRIRGRLVKPFRLRELEGVVRQAERDLASSVP